MSTASTAIRGSATSSAMLATTRTSGAALSPSVLSTAIQPARQPSMPATTTGMSGTARRLGDPAAGDQRHRTDDGRLLGGDQQLARTLLDAAGDQFEGRGGGALERALLAMPLEQ